MTKSNVIYSGEMTLASKIFTGPLLIERPEDMDYQLYRTLIRLQSRALKRVLRKAPLRRVANLMPTNRGYNLHY